MSSKPRVIEFETFAKKQRRAKYGPCCKCVIWALGKPQCEEERCDEWNALPTVEEHLKKTEKST